MGDAQGEERRETVSCCPECAAYEASKAEKLSALREVNADLLAALEAMLIMSDAGGQPRKLDEALTWRENDEKARAMATAAIRKAKGAKK